MTVITNWPARGTTKELSSKRDAPLLQQQRAPNRHREVWAPLQAPDTLSPDQKATLESVYLLIRTTRPLLDLICAKANLNDVDRIQLQSIIRLLLLNESRLVEHFPGIKTLEEKCDRCGGVS